MTEKIDYWNKVNQSNQDKNSICTHLNNEMARHTNANNCLGIHSRRRFFHKGLWHQLLIALSLLPHALLKRYASYGGRSRHDLADNHDDTR